MVALSILRAFALSGVVAYAQTNQIQWIDCSKNVPDPMTNLDTTGVNLSSLPSELRCGQIVVPMDYSKPLNVSNNITLGLAMYRPAKPKGALFFCPGGTDPGVAAAWRIALNQTNDFLPDFTGLLDFDIMVMDIRGTWSSNQLNVSLDVFDSLFGPYPTTQAEFDDFKAASATMAQSFVNSSSPPGIVQFVGTNEVVQDYETIRKALGYDTINFLGASYGSFRVAQYAATFPGRVGNFVLDAVVPHGITPFEQASFDVAAVNRAILRADAYCQNNASCPFQSQGKGIIPEVYNEVLAAAANASASDPNNNATITPWDVKSLAVGLLSGQPVFPDFFTLLSAAVSGNSSALSAATSSSSSGPPLGAIIAIPYLCTDTAIQNNTFANFHDALTTSGAHDIYNLTQSSSLQLKLFCSAWPFPTTPLQPLNLTDPNMLIVTADFDVDTPMEKAVKVWQTQATNSTLVVRHGDDHVSFNLPEVDSTGLTKTFLNTGILPCARDEVLLSVYPPGSAGPGGPRDPYSVPTGLLAGDCPDDAAGCNLS